MKKLIAIAMMTLGFQVIAAPAAAPTPAPAPYIQALPFSGKVALTSVQGGQTTLTIRLGDRTAAPASYKVGQVLPLVNSDRAEEPRTFEEQVKAEAYKYVEFTKVLVSQVTALSAAEQEEVKKYYSPEKIAEAKGVVTVLTFKYRNSK